MSPGSGRTVCVAMLTLQLFALSTAFSFMGQRRGTAAAAAAGRDVFVSRDQLQSTNRKKMQDVESVRRLKDFVDQLTTNSRRSFDDTARQPQKVVSRGPERRRAALDDEDTNYAVDYTRDVKRDRNVAGPSRDQRLLQKLNLQPRQDFMYAIGAAQAPSSSSYGSSSDLFDSPYGSRPSWDSNSEEVTDDASYEFVWVECEENDPDPACQEERA